MNTSYVHDANLGGEYHSIDFKPVFTIYLNSIVLETFIRNGLNLFIDRGFA